MNHNQIVRAVQQQLLAGKCPSLDQTKALLDLVEDLQAERQHEYRLVQQARLNRNTYHALIAAHQALVTKHARGTRVYERMEKALQQSEQRFRAMFEGAAIGIALVDMSGHAIESNPALQKMLGYSKEELRRMVFTEFTHPDDVSKDVALCTELMSGQRDHYQLEKRYIRKDGQIIWGRLTVSLVRDADGEPQFGIGMVEDITDHKRDEEALRFQKSLLVAQSEASIDAILVVSPAREILSFNQRFSEMWNIPQEVLATRSDEAALHAVEDMLVDPAAFRARLAYLYEHPTEASHEEIRLRDGRILERYSAPVIGGDGTYYGRVWFFRDSTERKRVEEALRQSEARFRILFEHSPDGIILTDPHQPDGIWTIVDCNDVACRMNGYTREELLGQPIDLLHTHYRDPETCPACLEWLRREGTVQIETLHRRKDGTLFPIESSISLINLCGQELILGIDRDITERKQAEEALRQNEARKAAILETALDCIITIDHTGRIVEWNPAAEQTFGYSREQAVGQELSQLIIPPSLREQYRQGLAHYFATGEGWLIDKRTEMTAMRVDGTEFPVELAVTCILIDGTPLFTGYVRDITERKRTEAAQHFLSKVSQVLAASLDYAITLQRIARLAVPFLADACFIDLLEADASLRHMGIAHVDPTKEQRLRDLQSRYPDTPRPDHIQQVLHTGQPHLIPSISDTLLQTVAQDAEQFRQLRALGFSSAMIVPLRTRGRFLGTIIFVIGESGRQYGSHDLTIAEDLAARAALAVDNARLYQQTQQALCAHEEFLSIASHELTGPLVGLSGAAQLLASRITGDHPTTEQDSRMLQVLIGATQQINKLIDALVDFSNIQAGYFNLQRQPVDLCELANKVVEELQSTPIHPVTLTCAAQPIVIEGDLPRLERVLYNLLQNAIKYSPAGGPINVRIEQRGAEAYLAVQDRGIGIPEPAQMKLFQRFYRASNATARHISGMGIGLYLVKEIVEHHGGKVEVVSSEGEGSTFILRFPLYKI